MMSEKGMYLCKYMYNMPIFLIINCTGRDVVFSKEAADTCRLRADIAAFGSPCHSTRGNVTENTLVHFDTAIILFLLFSVSQFPLVSVSLFQCVCWL